MDRLKNIGSSVRAKVPGQEQKPSYAGYADSRTAAKNDDGALAKMKGFVPDRVVSERTRCGHSHMWNSRLYLPELTLYWDPDRPCQAEHGN